MSDAADVSRETSAKLTEEGFARLADVSRETSSRLAAYLDLLARWNERVNLVGRSTLADPWRRHILDSAQLHPLLPQGARTLVDLGSGAGLPGVVLAILGGVEIHLVESDQRKCAFIREALRVTGATATVHNRRIEAVAPFAADVVTARALAPLDDLLALSEPFRRPETLCLFLKGEKAGEELAAAATRWSFAAERIPSRADPAGAVLRLARVKPMFHVKHRPGD